MTLLNTLQTSGITLGMVQMTIIAGIVVYIIGTYWKVLLTGAGIITIAVILLYSESNGNKPSTSTVVVERTTTNAPVVESVPPPTLKVMPTVPDAFMEDCMKDAEYTKEECEKIWTNP
jgi:hypothetical protein